LQDANPTTRPEATPPPPIPNAHAMLRRTESGRAIHPGSNAAAVTPRESKFTKMGEDLTG